MQAHARYLELRFAQTESRPELHRHQRDALEQLLRLARSGLSPRDYVRQSQGLFALVRAEWLDRHQGRARLFDALGEQQLARAARAHGAAAEASSNLLGFLGAIHDAQVEWAPTELAAATCQATVPKLVLALWVWATAGSPQARLFYSGAPRKLWQVLREHDPGCTWERIREHPPYRNCLPFSDQRLDRIGAWLDEVVGPTLSVVEPPPPLPLTRFNPGPLPTEEALLDFPSVSEAAAGFHAACDPHRKDPKLAEVVAVYERIFDLEEQATDTSSFLMEVEQADLVCELARAHQRIVAADYRGRAQGASQPHLEAHARLLRKAVDRAQSRTEIELQVARHDYCLRVEAAWNQVLLHMAFRPVMMALASEWDTSDSRRVCLERSYQVTTEMLGVSWEEIFTVPRLWDFFATFLFTRGQGLMEVSQRHPVSTTGEVGYGLVSGLGKELMHCTLDQVRQELPELDPQARHDEAWRRLNAARFATPEAMRDHLSQLFAAGIGERDPRISRGPAAHRVLTLWGQDIPLEAVHEAVRTPARPGG